MNPLAALKQALNQLLQTAVADAAAPLILEPLVKDTTALDCFADEHKGNPEQSQVCAKLGLKSAAKPERVFTGGEVVLQTDPGKTYEKLMREGHAHDVTSEDELSKILAEVDELPGPSAAAQMTVVSPQAPMPMTRPELHDTVFPPLEDEDARGQSQSGDDESENETSEPADPQNEEETNRALQAKLHYQKLDTFA